MRKIFLFIAFISMYFLGQAQYAPTSSKTRFVNGIGLSTKDTASLSNAGDTLAMIVGKDSLVYFKYKGYWKPIAYNSSLNSYVKYSDTSSMLSPYQRSFSAMKYSDTATMLSSYYNKTATNSLLNTKLNTSDTATMLSGYKTYYPRNAISGGTGISYNPSTGVITNTSSGTVTSVATNNASGITGGTITTSGTIAADTSILATRLRVQKGIDSVNANVSLKLNISDTANMLSGYKTYYPRNAISGGTGITYNAGTGVITNSSPSTGGTVTSVATDATMTGGTITTTGTLKVDTTVMATRLRVQKGIDSVNANVNLRVKYSDTATMLSSYYNKTATDSKLALKLNISDTATMLSPYARTLALGGYIPYTGATSAIDLNSKTVVNISHLGINTTSVPTILLRAIGDNNSSSRIAMRGYSSDANSSSIRVTKFRGTVAAPQAPQSGDGLGKFELAGYGTTSSDGYPQASFEGIATENWGATARGAKVQVKVTPNTTITQAIALTINQDKSAVFENSITGTSLIKTGGTSSQFLKADGSVDANAYLNISDTATMLSGYKTYYPRAALSAGTGITYNASTGVITNSSPSTGGTVTSVATDATMTGGTITTSGTLKVDTSIMATRLRVQKGIDSLGAAKQNAGTYVTSVTGTSPIVSSGGTTPAISIPVATSSVNGYLSSTDWTTFNNKQSALTNPVTGTGTTNYLPKFTGTSTIGNSAITDDGTTVTLISRALKYSADTWNTSSDGLQRLYFSANSITYLKGTGVVIRDNNDLNILTLSTGGLATFSGTVNTPTKYTWGTANDGTTGQIATDNTNNYFDFKGNLYFRGAAASNTLMTLSSTGNLGLGVTPSAWGSNYKVLQIGNATFWSQTGSGSGTFLSQNGYFDGSGWKYISNYNAAVYIQGSNGEHQWFNAPSGTAGNAITFTQAMTLNASGNLSIGNTNDTYKLDVNGTGRFSGALTGINATFSSNIIIGSGAASYALDIYGSAGVGMEIYETSTGTNKRLRITQDAANVTYDATYSSGGNGHIFKTGGGAALTIANGGAATFSSRLMVNSPTDDGSTTLQVNGTGRFSGALTGTTSIFGGGSSYSYLNPIITASQNGNGTVSMVVNNQYNGSSAYSKFVVATYGNSWYFGMGSSTSTYGNDFTFTTDATTSNSPVLRLSTTGAATFSSSVTATSYGRASAGTGYLNGGYSGVENTSTTGPIYCIGSSYAPTSTTLNTMYGIGYSYNNFTGAYGPANTWGMYVAGGGGANIFLGAESGNGYFNGKVLIGTTTDNGSKLQVSGAATFSSSVKVNGASGALSLDVLSTSQYDGIRTYNTSSTQGADIRVGNDANNNLGFLRVGGSALGNANANTLMVGTGGGYDIHIAPNGTPAITVKNGGNVGIGTTSPNSLLEVYGQTRVSASGGSVFLITPDATSTNGITLESSYYASAGYGPMKFNTGGSERIRITSGGNVGIGTTSPSYALEVYSNQSVYTSRFYQPSASTSAYNSVVWNGAHSPVIGYITTGGSTVGNAALQNTFGIGSQNAYPVVFISNDAERMRITSGGNVLIGTTTDAGYKLDVNGTGRFTGSGNALRMHSSSNDVWATFVPQSGNTWRIQATTGSVFGIYNENSATFPFQIASTGAATFSSTLGINGVADNIKSGTYTPTITGVSNYSSSTARVCQYSRVGNTVTVSGSVYVTGTSLASGSETEIRMSLPISSALAQSYQLAGAGGLTSGIAGGYGSATVWGDATNDAASLRYPEWDGISGREIYFTYTYQVL